MVDDLALRLGDLTAAQVVALDAAAARLGMDTERLMEHAGWQVARYAAALVPRGEVVTVVCGAGNNGGDGVVASRLLATWGYAVRTFVYADQSRLSEAFNRRLEPAKNCGVVCRVGCELNSARNSLKDSIEESGLVLDALLGSGLSGPPRPDTADVIAAMSEARTLAVDVPSGLDATTGVAGSCVRAAATCTLAAMKHGLYTPQGRATAGDIVVADIGMPAQAWIDCGLNAPTAVTGGALVPLSKQT